MGYAIEFHTTASSLLNQFTNTLRATPIIIPEEFLNGQYLIDRVESNARPELRFTVPAQFKIQVAGYSGFLRSALGR